MRLPASLLCVVTLLVPLFAQDASPKPDAKNESDRTAPDGPDSLKLSDARDILLKSRAVSANRTPVKPLTPEEERMREAARKRGDYTFDDLKFDIDKDEEFEESMLSDSVKALDKKKMRIRGFILPSSVFVLKGIKQFVLVRDNQECCFGPGAAIYDCIMVEMEGDKTAEYTTRPITVSGTFAIDTESFQYPNGGHYAIFKMAATEAK